MTNQYKSIYLTHKQHKRMSGLMEKLKFRGYRRKRRSAPLRFYGRWTFWNEE